MDDFGEYLKQHILIICILILILFLFSTKKVHAECIPPENVQKVVDISSDRKLVVICETSSKYEADNELENQSIDNCFVSKEQGEELYRVICPYIVTESK